MPSVGGQAKQNAANINSWMFAAFLWDLLGLKFDLKQYI